MSDLVERLRQASNRGMEHKAGAVRAYCDAITLSEAAAEIERLTAALASQREECALVVDRAPYDATHDEIASAIRARGTP